MRPLGFGEVLDRGVSVVAKSARRAFRVSVALVVAALVVIVAPFYAPQGYHLAIELLVRLALAVVLLFTMCAIVEIYASEALQLPCTPAAAFTAARHRFFPACAYALLSLFGVGAIVLFGYGVLLALTYVENRFVSDENVMRGMLTIQTITWSALFVVLYGVTSAIAGSGFVTCVFEPQEPLAALRFALARSWRDERWKRTLCIGLAMVAPQFVVAVLPAPLGFFLGTHLEGNWRIAAGAVAEMLVSGLQYITLLLSYAWVVVDYFDSRVRSEGLDLVAAIEPAA